MESTNDKIFGIKYDKYTNVVEIKRKADNKFLEAIKRHKIMTMICIITTMLIIVNTIMIYHFFNMVIYM